MNPTKEREIGATPVLSQGTFEHKVLACQGLALRGHGDHESDSNFLQLMKLSGELEDDSRISAWLV